jgi:hypothetical protein
VHARKLEQCTRFERLITLHFGDLECALHLALGQRELRRKATGAGMIEQESAELRILVVCRPQAQGSLQVRRSRCQIESDCVDPRNVAMQPRLTEWIAQALETCQRLLVGSERVLGPVELVELRSEPPIHMRAPCYIVTLLQELQRGPMVADCL